MTAFKRVAYEAIHWVDRHPHAYTLMVLGLFLSTVAGLGISAYHLVRAF